MVLNMRNAVIGGATPNLTNSAIYRTFRILLSMYWVFFVFIIPKNSLLRASRTGVVMSSFDITLFSEAITLRKEAGKRKERLFV